MAQRIGIEKAGSRVSQPLSSGAGLQLVRLLQLASPALPVGAYSYSQGLEAAVEAAVVSNAASAAQWIGDVFHHSVARTEAPVVLRLIDRWRAGDGKGVEYWNAFFLASRETAEFRGETVQMGYSLVQLLAGLDGMEEDAMDRLKALVEPSFPASFAFAAAEWNVAPAPAVVAYLWAWLENQVTAAVRAVPLGQTDGQRMLLALGAKLPAIVGAAAAAADDEIGAFAPRLAILSSRHETQYSRLFRS